MKLLLTSLLASLALVPVLGESPMVPLAEYKLLLTDVDEPFNAGIQGDGYFRVRTKSGTIGYTRNGSFSYDFSVRKLVNGTDEVLIDDIDLSSYENFPELPNNKYYVKSDGQVLLKKASGESAVLGRISL